MKKQAIKILALIVVGGGLLSGCSSQRSAVVTPTGQVMVPEAPPAPRQEVKGTPPARSSVWVSGHWVYENSQWVWVPGQWESPPLAGQTWVDGYWRHTAGGWIYTAGHWE